MNGKMPDLEDEHVYLMLVNVEDCIKDLVIGLYSMQLKHTINKRVAWREKRVKWLIKNRTKPDKKQKELELDEASQD